MMLYCEDCRCYFDATDFGDGRGLVGHPGDEPHVDHEWSNPSWYPDGR